MKILELLSTSKPGNSKAELQLLKDSPFSSKSLFTELLQASDNLTVPWVLFEETLGQGLSKDTKTPFLATKSNERKKLFKKHVFNYRPQSRSRIHPGSSENWIPKHQKATFEMTVSLISTGAKESKVFTSSLQELRRRNCQRMIKVTSDKQLSSFRSWRVRL